LGYKGLLGALVSALLIWWTLRGESPGEIWAALRSGNLWLLGGSVFVATAGFVLRAMRWRVLLEPLAANTSLNSRFGAVTIGFMANNLLPARVGEFVRAYALSRMERVTMSGALGTLVVERVLDGVVLLLFLLLPPLIPGFPDAGSGSAPLRTVLGGASFGLALILAVLGTLFLWPSAVLGVSGRLLRRVPEHVGRRALGALEAFLEALQVMRRPALLMQATLWSFAFWTWHAISFWLGMAAFGIREGFAAALFTEAAVGFGVALPSAPGFLGTFHAAAAWALEGVYGVDAARSLAFAYGFHLGGFIPVTLIGLWYARRVGLSLREMGRTEEAVERDLEVEGAQLVRATRLANPPPEEPPPGNGDDPARPTTSDRIARRSSGRGELAAVELEAPAKVNLFLHVLDREPSGYHNLRTLFQSLELADRVRVELASSPGVALEVTGLDAGPPRENLVRKAADAYLDAAGQAAGVRIRLEKRIPVGGGLGGGSSDAAATLRALDLLFPGAVPPPDLIEIAARLGSDVPFFLCGSPLALGAGRGERLTPLEPLPAADVILAVPPVSVSTAWAYGALDRRRASAARTPLAPSDHPTAAPDQSLPRLQSWDSLAPLGVNDFEDVVLEEHPRIAAARQALLETGPSLALLSGSGSTVFALYSTAGAAERALAHLTGHVGIRVVRTRTRTTLPEARTVATGSRASERPSRQRG
jgi:4-diphosphocytidyl-2C-methyl-D-erythritol kinase